MLNAVASLPLQISSFVKLFPILAIIRKPTSIRWLIVRKRNGRKILKVRAHPSSLGRSPRCWYKQIVEDVIAALPRDGSVDRALNDLWPWVMQHRKDEGPHLYVFCLSEHDDLLSQWRAYGAQGAGYAIGRASFRSCRSFRWISCDPTP